MSQELKALFTRPHEAQLTPQVRCLEVESHEFFEFYGEVVRVCGVPVLCLPVSRGMLVRFEPLGPVAESDVNHLLVKSVDPESFEMHLKKVSQNVAI